MDQIRVLIADDHAIVRMGLTALLESKANIQVVDEAKNGDLAVRKALKLHPDVIVMDLLMPVKDGIAATREIAAAETGTKVLILTTSTVPGELNAALQAGAAGIVIKSSSNTELVKAITELASGKRYLPAEVAKIIAQDQPAPDLTQRQIDILAAVAKGRANSEIATQLGISEIMVKKHLSTIFQKLGAANRAEASTIAVSKKIVKL